MRISRDDRSRVGEWWFTVDHVLFGMVLLLVITGVVLSLVASPSAAAKKGLETYYFVERHVAFAVSASAILWIVSLLSPREVRRLALILFAASLAGLVAVHVYGAELNGARRWLSIGGHSLQPSEFLKPAFVVIMAWLLAEAQSRSDMPALPFAVLGLGTVLTLLVAQPDVGQTLLISIVWLSLFFMSGQPIRRTLVLLSGGAAGLVAAYATLGHVRYRVDRFFTPQRGDNSQIDRAMQSFAEGGFLGRGPGEGTIKTSLPDAHTDFIFAVIAEEYGVVACLLLLTLFAFIVGRAVVRAAREPEPTNRLAILGLAFLFGLQALINMAVNVGLLPAKGITLPFISAGGSSMLAVAIGLGMLLALTRRRAVVPSFKTPRLGDTVRQARAVGHSR